MISLDEVMVFFYLCPLVHILAEKWWLSTVKFIHPLGFAQKAMTKEEVPDIW